MAIFTETIDRRLPELAEQGVREPASSACRDRAPEELQRKMQEMEATTAENTRLQLWIAFDYGGRAELVDAALGARRRRRGRRRGGRRGDRGSAVCPRDARPRPARPDVG